MNGPTRTPANRYPAIGETRIALSAGATDDNVAGRTDYAIRTTAKGQRYLDAQIAQRMRSQGIRVEVDESDDRMQKKIRNAQLQKVPFMVIAGDQDVEGGGVSFRYRDGRQDNGVPLAEAVERVVAAVKSREQV